MGGTPEPDAYKTQSVDKKIKKPQQETGAQGGDLPHSPTTLAGASSQWIVRRGSVTLQHKQIEQPDSTEKVNSQRSIVGVAQNAA